MKKIYTLFAATIIAGAVSAKTYHVGSGKWTDAKLWNNEYPGNIIKSDDVVIINGQVTMNTGVVVEGTLQVEKGAGMVGMKDLMVAKGGTFVNNGNTVMNRIINEGTINNNLIMEAMNNIDNKGRISNNNNIVTGNNFESYGGNASGKNGAYYINNVANSNPTAFGGDVKVFFGNQLENSVVVPAANTSALSLDLAIKSNRSVELNILNPNHLDIAMFSIEKSVDGKNYNVIDMVSKMNKGSEHALCYTDSKVDFNLTYYRVKAISAEGNEITLPIASVKVPSYTNSTSLANN